MEKQNVTLVIFGISGDLAQRKLLPALAEVCKNGQLPTAFRLLGVSRRKLQVKDVLGSSTASLRPYTEIFQMDLDKPSDYQSLKTSINSLSDSPPTIFYFAVPPATVLPIVQHLGMAGLNHHNAKLLLEKPFGVDYKSAQKLIEQTDQYFKEEQVYRIDHFLAKEMAQNIAVFLGGNVLFRGVWSNKFIDKIEVLAAEEIDIEGRATFYEQAGALLDFVQSHMLQLTALVLMDPCPDVFDFSEVPRRRLAALKQLALADPKNFLKCVRRAQYDGYRQEVNNPRSVIETFVYLKLQSKDPRWQGVPLHIATGKALDRKYTEIRVHFKKSQAQEANLLTLRIQPREGIELDLWTKKPGYEHELQRLPLQFSYQQYFGSLPDAYEQVLVDAMRGRANLFASSAEILASWKILDPILKKWDKGDSDLKFYKKGSTLEEVLDT